ncbi:MAG: hypothetical protein ACSHX8_08375 [Opitutaceae bacterium]
MIEKIIKNVMELHGVDGACILDKKGNLLHNALPDFFLDDFLDDLARRVKALYEAVDENYVACDDYLLKFPQKYIQIRRSRNIYLLVAVDPSVNLVSLRMVTNLVLKYVTPKVLSEMRKQLAETKPTVSESAIASTAPSETPAPTVMASEPEAPKRGNKVLRPRPTRSFRGTRY